MTRDDCRALDADDPLAPLRGQFALDRVDRDGIIYLDGNSLGALPRATSERVREVIEDEWGVGLIRSWNTAGWISLSQRIADKIARLIGAQPGEVVVCDSTSINLYKVLSAAIAIAKADAPQRRQIISERWNFPTDLYIAETLAHAHGFELVLVDDDAIATALNPAAPPSTRVGTASPAPGMPRSFDRDVAIIMLTHVNYRTGRMHHMADVTRAAHDAGAIVVWDLAHSAGAVPVDVHGAGVTGSAADFAVGCGYKYLNGGPGAPAFAWAHPRHTSRMEREDWRQPLSGWFGHAAPFDFVPEYRPAAGMLRFLSGTPPIVALAALEGGVDTVLAAVPLGGLAAIRRKSMALTSVFIELVESRCAGHGLTLVTPRADELRGSQVAFAHATDAYAIMQAAIARGVIGDFRAPDLLRFGFTPLYTRFVDAWDAVDRLARLLGRGEWRDPRYAVRAAVT
jgi:kynureninase